MAVRLLYHYKRSYDDGAILEARVWELEKPVTGSAHRFKYRLFYGLPGVGSSATTTSAAKAIIVTWAGAKSVTCLSALSGCLTISSQMWTY